MGKALAFGIAGSFFFAFNFILMRSMNLTGGFWLWTGVLRYVFSLPMFFALLLPAGRWRPVIEAIKKQPAQWLLWSTVGFGFFYMPNTAASIFAESWFTAAIWQVTIVCGVLLTPLFGKPIPKRNLACSAIVLVGIAIMQIPKAASLGGASIAAALLLMLVSAFSYPLGNRKVMALCSQDAEGAPEGLDTVQRIFGMTICSMPFWLVCAVVAGFYAGPPNPSQVVQGFAMAAVVGVLATILFFKATDLVRDDHRRLAVVEATQSGEVVFTLLLGVTILGDPAPDGLAWVGLALIVAGMVANSLVAGKPSAQKHDK